MPVKRRAGKSRFVAHWGATFTEAEVWSAVFDTGCDLLSLLHFIGHVETQDLRPPMDLARDAWRRLGADYLAADPGRGRWALAEFGEPA